MTSAFHGSRGLPWTKGWWQSSPSPSGTMIDASAPSTSIVRRPVRSTPEMTIAQTLADVTTAYLLNAQARAAKTEFVATVSHELRTPMTSIAASSSCSRTMSGTLTEDQRGSSMPSVATVIG